MNTKNRMIIIAFIAIIVLAIFSVLVSSACPKTRYSVNELRSNIREIAFIFLSDPAGSFTKEEIVDLIVFYRNEKDKSLVDDCEVKAVPSLSDENISVILAKAISSQRECSDGIDNDGDGLIDLADAGCTDLNDNDETNCGDNSCEGSETCTSCDSDCGSCSIWSLFMKNTLQNVISFSKTGDVVLRGELTQNPNPLDTSEDEFIVRDSSGDNVAVINLITGNMVIKGDLFEEQETLTPPTSGNNFVVKDSDGNVINYIDESGNFYLKGRLTQNENP